MTSVPNRRLQLNGSSIVACFLFISLFIACTPTKRTTAKQKDTSPPSTENEDKVRVYDPATGTYVLVPRDAVKVDTVKWTEDKAKPILTDKEDVTKTPEKKSHYDISLLLPLNSSNYPEFGEYLDQKLVRFMQYYGGMRIAAEEVEQMGLPVTFRSFDTEIAVAQLDEILRTSAVRNSDVIVGPYDKENVEAVAVYGKSNEKFVISPWLPAFSTETENPYFIQILPGLNTHADAIMEFISEEFHDKKIFLVARNNPAEIQRLALFKKNSRVRTEDLIIDDESIDLAKTNLGFLLDDPQGTIFIMPYYSRQDENFINSFMRKLHADKGNKEVIVFGLPQWTGFNSLNSNYMESLSLHISSPAFINPQHPSYSSFRNKFFHQYFTMPDQQAYLGYDLVMWIAKTLSSQGTSGFLDGTSSEFGLASGFKLKPIYKDEIMKPSEMHTPLYYENSRVRILEFRDQDFELVW